ncbi:MAG: hypothetical protein QOF48_83 [Verrucomicrobiota bacterium]
MLAATTMRAGDPKPLVNAHAHNDYEHARPLVDALEHSFGSVEADGWLVNGRLLVAHDRTAAKPERTLEALYLDPLRERVRKNGGRVYKDGPSLTLLVDVKSDATNTWKALRSVLQNYEPMLTRFANGRTHTNAVTVIVSGNRARGSMEADTNRLAAYDGRLADLKTNIATDFIPLISDNWSQLSSWRGGGDRVPPADGAAALKDAVAQAHAQGCRIRFWGAPDTPEIWTLFRSAGVDLLNADDLDGLRDYLLKP